MERLYDITFKAEQAISVPDPTVPLVPVQSDERADVDISGDEFDFVRSIRVYHIQFSQRRLQLLQRRRGLGHRHGNRNRVLTNRQLGGGRRYHRDGRPNRINHLITVHRRIAQRLGRPEINLPRQRRQRRVPVIRDDIGPDSHATTLLPCQPRRQNHQRRTAALPRPPRFGISAPSRQEKPMTFRARHLLGIEHLAPQEIVTVLDLADRYVDLNRRTVKQSDVLAGMTQINMFFENSTRTQASFELAGKRLGADVMNMSVTSSSVKKGETLIDTAMTLNAMHPDLLVVRHSSSGAVNLLASKVNCAVLNAGDGRHEHPTQALLDALTIRRAKGRIQRLTVAICGDIAHSRVARSNLILLGKMENRLRLIAPPTLMPSGVEDFGCELFDDMRKGLEGADVVMMLRLQNERMDGGFIPSSREYYHRYGLDAEKLSHAKPDAIVMHPGPMNRGVEIDGDLADDINRSVIQEQVEMGVAVRMACMDLLARNLRAERGRKAVGVMV